MNATDLDIHTQCLDGRAGLLELETVDRLRLKYMNALLVYCQPQFTV